MQDYLAFRLDLEDAEVVSAYDELPLWSAMFGLLLLAHLPLRRHTTVLDVGHGTGFPAIELAERLGSTCRVHGIDRWGMALNRARHKAQVRGVENVRLWQGDAAAMPFRDGEFDLVVSNLGINNFSDRDADPATFYTPEAYRRLCEVRRRVDPQRVFLANHQIAR